MCIAFHPRLPAVIAGGTFNGMLRFDSLCISFCVLKRCADSRVVKDELVSKFNNY